MEGGCLILGVSDCGGVYGRVVVLRYELAAKILLDCDLRQKVSGLCKDD